jgi:hypothetical protein
VIQIALPVMLVGEFNYHTAMHNSLVESLQLSCLLANTTLNSLGRLQVAKGNLQWKYHRF